jgi:hypothetical protein
MPIVLGIKYHPEEFLSDFQQRLKLYNLFFGALALEPSTNRPSLNKNNQILRAPFDSAIGPLFQGRDQSNH